MAVNFIKAAKTTRLKNGKLFQLKISTNNASGIGVIFSRFKLAPEAEFYIYNSQKTLSLGPFKNTDCRDINNFATFPFGGSQIILELFEPNKVSMASEIIISGVSLVDSNLQKNFSQVILNQQAISVNCPIASNFQKEKDAVVAMVRKLSNNSLVLKGTGYFIRPVKDDTDNLYLMSSKTALSSTMGLTEQQYLDIASNTFLLFNFESGSCSVKNYYGDGATNYPLSSYGLALLSGGFDVLYSYYKNYVFLYAAKVTIPKAAKYYQLGWNRTSSPSSVQPYTLIGHNESFYSTPNYAGPDIESKTLITASYDRVPLTGHFIFNNVNGYFNGGYTGAPVIDKDHRVIGTYGNYINGYLAYSFGGMWNNDPWIQQIIGNNTSMQTLDGKYCIDTKNLRYSSEIYSNKDILADENLYLSSTIYGGDVKAKANTSITLKPGFEVKQGATFEIGLNPCN